MLTEREILEKMEEYTENLESAESWYLASQGLNQDQINENLRIKYGSSQGYAKFKDDIEEMSEGIFSVDYGTLKLEINEESKKLVDIQVADVGDSFANIGENAFLMMVEGRLREDMEERVLNLPKETRLLAKILRRAEGLEKLTDIRSAWGVFTLLTGQLLTDPEKEDVVASLIRSHCYYKGVGATPMLMRLEPVEDYLPEIEIKYPK